MMRILDAMIANSICMTAICGLWLLVRALLWQHIRPSRAFAIGMILAVGLLVPFRPALPSSVGALPSIVPPETSALGALHYALAYDAKLTPMAIEQATEAAEEDLPNPNPTQSDGRMVEVWQAIFAVWLIGMVLSMALHAYRHVRLYRHIKRWKEPPGEQVRARYDAIASRMGIRRPPSIALCEAITSPMLVGLARPIILLPEEGWEDEELCAILVHELLHFKRHDLHARLVMLLARCVHWYNPIVHVLAFANASDCEMACDAKVLQHADAIARKKYGEAVLSAITRERMPHAELTTYFYSRRIDMKRRFVSMLVQRKRRLGGAMLAAMMLLCVLTGSVLGDSAGSQRQAAMPSSTSPTTGMAYPDGRGTEYRPVLVSIGNNENERPAFGLSQADVIYESVYWGPGYTRYTALFNDYHPEFVGSARSTREFGWGMQQEWDAHFAFHGMNESTTAYVKRLGVPAAMYMDGVYADTGIAAIDKAFSKTELREEPHNSIINIRAIVEELWHKDAQTKEPYAPKAPIWAFGDVQRDLDPVHTITIDYDGGRGEMLQEGIRTFAYDAAKGVYLRSVAGKPEIDVMTGEQIAASNVLIQVMPITYPNNVMAEPELQVVGEGGIDAFINGVYIRGTWQKQSIDSPTVYRDEQDQPLALKPGKTFIQIIPNDAHVSMT